MGQSSSASPTRRGLFTATVLRNTQICSEHFRLTLALPGFPASTPGQFVQLACDDPRQAQTEARFVPPAEVELPAPRVWEPGHPAPHTPDDHWQAAYLRRPFSIAGQGLTPSGVPWIDVIHRVVGRGTHYLATLHQGQEVSVLGPLGQGFALPENMHEALLVGGGVGIPPMLYLAEMLSRANQRAIAFVGAQRQDLVPLTFPANSPSPSPDGTPVANAHEFAQFGFPTVLTTDDGSRGMKGFVTAALDKYLRQHAAGRVIFCCGPTPMMKATAQVAAAHGVRCFVSLEQPMACGMGTCQSCVVKIKAANAPDDWVYKLTCTDGPVFETGILKW